MCNGDIGWAEGDRNAPGQRGALQTSSPYFPPSVLYNARRQPWHELHIPFALNSTLILLFFFFFAGRKYDSLLGQNNIFSIWLKIALWLLYFSPNGAFPSCFRLISFGQKIHFFVCESWLLVIPFFVKISHFWSWV